MAFLQTAPRNFLAEWDDSCAEDWANSSNSQRRSDRFCRRVRAGTISVTVLMDLPAWSRSASSNSPSGVGGSLPSGEHILGIDYFQPLVQAMLPLPHNAVCQYLLPVVIGFGEQEVVVSSPSRTGNSMRSYPRAIRRAARGPVDFSYFPPLRAGKLAARNRDFFQAGHGKLSGSRLPGFTFRRYPTLRRRRLAAITPPLIPGGR